MSGFGNFDDKQRRRDRFRGKKREQFKKTGDNHHEKARIKKEIEDKERREQEEVYLISDEEINEKVQIAIRLQELLGREPTMDEVFQGESLIKALENRND